MLSMVLRRGLVPMVSILVALWLVTMPAAAQDAASGDERSESYARLADILEDEQARERLISELRSQAGSGDAGAGEQTAADGGEAAGEAASLPRQIADFTQGLAEGFVSEFREAAGVLGRLGSTGAGADFSGFGAAALELVLVIAVTLAAFFLLRRLARPLFARTSAWAMAGFGDGLGLIRRAVAVVAAALADLVVIVLAWLAGYALALFVLGDAGMMDTRQALFLNAFLLIEVFKAVIRIVFASRDEGLRLLPMAGEEAAYWNLWLARLAGVIGYGLMVAVPIINADLAPELGRVAAIAIMAAAFLYALVIILQNRQRVRDKLGARAASAATGFGRSALQLLGRVWHLLAIAYFAALTVATLVRPEDALPYMVQATLQTLVAIGGGVFVSVLLSQVIGRRIHVPEETRQRFPSLEERLNAFVPTALKVVRGVILIGVVSLVLDAWSIFDLGAWLASDAGTATLATAVTVALIVAAAAGIWIAVASWIEHRLTPEARGREAGSRERTLLAIFRNAFAVILMTMTAMIVLSEIGINIGPLIAGAGVLGLAVGFGAQKLVQDVITGVFIQLENAINVGDFVTAGGLSGTVEKLTIRSLAMRDLAGTYHMVPFSSVDTVSNYMRDYGYHLGDYGVAYREDTDEVIARLQEAFDELMQDPDQSKAILGGLEVFGVTALGDSSVSVRVRIKTVPGMQWAVGRAYNRLVKRHLDAAGIEIPFPHMTLYFGQDKDGAAPPANVRMLGGAAEAPAPDAATAPDPSEVTGTQRKPGSDPAE
ncbi:mechanosensitive ion channel [Aquisalimonas lutea]|uniref:mechanosensitive ion channel domain-containing protein n=1 Tax=Aquisalimonas lutea TaxID=1327750 RepID=UPI0025B561A8|nr:mechanosensitive ion channel domain-containing protein [Aquisalimonas lutea]MDN3516203.1 mechanosensitive ion channel [Aquisalimonas lutea]